MLSGSEHQQRRRTHAEGRGGDSGDAAGFAGGEDLAAYGELEKVQGVDVEVERRRGTHPDYSAVTPESNRRRSDLGIDLARHAGQDVELWPVQGVECWRRPGD